MTTATKTKVCPKCGVERKLQGLNLHIKYCKGTNLEHDDAVTEALSRQEQIRKVINLYTDDECLYPDESCTWCSKEGYCASGNDAYTCLMKRLDELGIVIKTDARFPGLQSRLTDDANEKILRKAGWAKTERLVE